MQTEKIKLALIKPYWRNPRKNERAVKAVEESIKRFGFNTPLILDRELTIIAGHTRYRALMNLGMDEADCVIVDLPPGKVKEYRIADNRTSEFSEWDWDKLIPELREIDNAFDFKVFFEDIDNLIGVGNKAVTNEQARAESESAAARFDDVGGAGQEAESMISLSCPECGATFSVARKDVLNEKIK